MGGATGLFVGASILSFMEIFYYFSFRLCHHRKAQDKENSNTVKTDKVHNANMQNKTMSHMQHIRRINVQPRNQIYLRGRANRHQFLPHYYYQNK